MKAIQYFEGDYLARCADMTSNDIARFLDDFRKVHGVKLAHEEKSKLISIKVPEPLLASFKAKASLQNKRYQTQIKQLMTDWVINDHS